MSYAFKKSLLVTNDLLPFPYDIFEAFEDRLDRELVETLDPEDDTLERVLDRPAEDTLERVLDRVAEETLERVLDRVAEDKLERVLDRVAEDTLERVLDRVAEDTLERAAFAFLLIALPILPPNGAKAAPKPRPMPASVAMLFALTWSEYFLCLNPISSLHSSFGLFISLPQ